MTPVIAGAAPLPSPTIMPIRIRSTPSYVMTLCNNVYPIERMLTSALPSNPIMNRKR